MTTYSKLIAIKEQLEALKTDPDILSAHEMIHGRPYKAIDSLGASVEYLDEVIGLVAEYHGIGEHAPTRQDLEHMALESKADMAREER